MSCLPLLVMVTTMALLALEDPDGGGVAGPGGGQATAVEAREMVEENGKRTGTKRDKKGKKKKNQEKQNKLNERKNTKKNNKIKSKKQALKKAEKKIKKHKIKQTNKNANRNKKLSAKKEDNKLHDKSKANRKSKGKKRQNIRQECNFTLLGEFSSLRLKKASTISKQVGASKHAILNRRLFPGKANRKECQHHQEQAGEEDRLHRVRVWSPPDMITWFAGVRSSY